MARESKRKRDAKRFGRTGRIADMIHDHDQMFGPPEWADRIKELSLRKLVDALRKDIVNRPRFYIDNVADYYYSHDKVAWSYAKDFPAVRPPYNDCWIEARRPAMYHEKGLTVPFSPCFPTRWGGIVDWLPGRFDSNNRFAGFEAIAQSQEMPEFVGFLRIMLIYSMGDTIIPIPTTYVMPLDARGNIIREPITLGIVEFATDHEKCRDAASDVGQFIQTILMALALLNCKNVSTVATEPDRELNRNRRKAGLEPFVKFHTLRIETLGRKVRKPGQSAGERFDKAWHLARGYFSHYTPEKPLFGIEGLHGDFWIPSHVRGKKEVGVIHKDYQVEP